MANGFAHLELTTTDLTAAKKFYAKLFDWKLKDMPMGPGQTYTLLDTGAVPGGGMQNKPMPDAPTQWLAYVEVADVKKCIAKAEKAGAKIMVPFMDIGSNGSLGIFSDPQGVMLGVWTPAAKAAPVKKAAAKKTTPKKAAAKKPAKKK